MSEVRQQRIRELRKQRAELQTKIDKLSSDIAQLDLEENHEEFPCVCVKRNRDIEVFDMQEQERRGRNPLTLGWVSESLSARRDCDRCKGTGKPAS